MRNSIIILAMSTALWAQDAAERFRVLVHQRAGLSALRQAAAEWEANEHDAARHLLAVEEIARAVIDLDPGLSLDYCRKVRSAPQLWPIVLDAEVRLRDWPLAERYGEAVMEEIDAGRLYSRFRDAAEEARMRRLYAAALDHQGKTEAAALEIAIADPAAVTTDAIRREGDAVAAVERARRIANLRSEVLATEIHQPAAPFRLRDLHGDEIALADYLGKPLVALFWATWCEPCVAELRQWNGFFEKFSGRLAAVSIDAEPQTAARFAANEGYRFPILFAERSTERAYTPPYTLNGGNIPQLYVFDLQGNIRFHVIGFEDDGMLAQKVEWMVEAALK